MRQPVRVPGGAGSTNRNGVVRGDVAGTLGKNFVLAAQGSRIARLHPREPQGRVLPVPQAG